MLTLFVCPNTILAEGPAKYLSSAFNTVSCHKNNNKNNNSQVFFLNKRFIILHKQICSLLGLTVEINLSCR